MNWGPYVLETKLPDYIIKRLLKDGDKLRKEDSYNQKLAGHLDQQFLYKVETQNWFYKEIHPILNAYRDGHCKYHGIENLSVELKFEDLCYGLATISIIFCRFVDFLLIWNFQTAIKLLQNSSRFYKFNLGMSIWENRYFSNNFFTTLIKFFKNCAY